MKRTPHRTRIPLSLLPCLSLLLWASLAQVAPAATEVSGDYRYTFHHPETATEAKAHACREATKAAVSRSSAFREATAAIVDSALLRETVEALVHEGLKDVRVVEQTEQGKTVSCTVNGWLEPSNIARVMATQIRGPESTGPGVDQNRALRILRITEDKDETLLVVFQALHRLDWLSTAYQGSLREDAQIMVEFLDGQGRHLNSASYPIPGALAGNEVMNPGEIGSLRIRKPAGTKSYRLWLTK